MSWILLVLVGALGCGRSGFAPLTGAPGDSGRDSTAQDGAPDDGSSQDGADAQTSFVAAFTLLSNAGALSARRATGAAVAPDDRIWVFGGFVGGVGAQNDLAAYTPGTGVWATLVGSNAPAARERHALAFDPGNNVLVVFGGFSATLTYYDELHIYSPGSNAWTLVPKSGSWPAPRKDAAMMWIPSVNQMLLYGGNNGSGTANRFSDLWLLSINPAGPSATWTLLAPGGVTAPAQSAGCTGYDPTDHRFILFGGETQDGTNAGTSYQYLLDTNVWQLDTTTGTAPSSRSFSQCAWDPGAGRLAVYGGQTNNPVGEQYLYEPMTQHWDMLALASGSSVPGSAGDAGAVYSAALGGMFWFGGRTGPMSYSNSSWLFDAQ